MVLGAGIVGTSIAAHLAKRGLSVALIDRQGAGEGTSYGNAGIIEGNTIFPPAFPSNFAELARIALKRSPVVNYHLRHLFRVAPWLNAFRIASQPAHLRETAGLMRPLFGRAVAEHEAIAAEAGAERYFNRRGWLKLYRSDQTFAALSGRVRSRRATRYCERAARSRRSAGARACRARRLSPRRSLDWRGERDQSAGADPRVRFALCSAWRNGIKGRCATLDRTGLLAGKTDSEPIDSADAVLSLGPWVPDVLDRLGIKLPLAVKRGNHPHFHPSRRLARPSGLDAENGYVLAPMEQASASPLAWGSRRGTLSRRRSSLRCCRQLAKCSAR